MAISMATKIVLIAGLVTFVTFASGCNTSSKTEYTKYDENKNVIEKGSNKTSEDAMVLQSMAPAIKACEVGVENRRKAAVKGTQSRNGMPQFTTAQILQLKAEAQRDYINKSFTRDLVITMSKQTGMVIAAFKKPPITCAQAVAMAVESYMEKEEVQAKQWGSTGLALAIAVPTAWVVNQSLKIMESAVSNQGDITVGEINATANGGDGGGEGSAGGAGGTLDLNLGRGTLTKVDNGSTLQRAEKQLINPVTDSGGTNTLDDSGDGSGNQAGINPFGQ